MSFLPHLLLQSLGLLLLTACIYALRPLLRRDPVYAYRLHVLLIIASFAAFLFQVRMQGARPQRFELVEIIRRIASPQRVESGKERSASPSGERVALGARHVADSALLPKSVAPPSRESIITAVSRKTPDLSGGDETAPSAGEEPSLQGSVGKPAPFPLLAGVRIQASRLVRGISSLRVPAARLYVLGVVAVVLLYGLRALHTWRIVRGARACDDRQALATWRELAHGSPLQDRARLLSCPKADSPACWGLLRPVVILPSTLDDRSLRFALSHELIHLQRRDSWVALLSMVFTAVLWFHPCAWWLARELSVLRELSCDELVVRRTGKRRRYACALLEYASRSAPRPSPCVTLMEWNRSKTQLRRRIEMLVANRNQPRGRIRGIGVVLTIAAAACIGSAQVTASATLLPGPRAQDTNPPSESKPGSTTAVEPAATSSSIAGRRVSPLDDPFGVSPGETQHALGIDVELVPEALAAQLELDRVQLLLVSKVHKGSRAGRSGLRKFDVITHINGEAPATFERLFASRDCGSVRFTIRRAGQSVEIVVPDAAPRLAGALLDSSGRPLAEATVSPVEGAIVATGAGQRCETAPEVPTEFRDPFTEIPGATAIPFDADGDGDLDLWIANGAQATPRGGMAGVPAVAPPPACPRGSVPGAGALDGANQGQTPVPSPVDAAHSFPGVTYPMLPEGVPARSSSCLDCHTVDPHAHSACNRHWNVQRNAPSSRCSDCHSEHMSGGAQGIWPPRHAQSAWQEEAFRRALDYYRRLLEEGEGKTPSQQAPAPKPAPEKPPAHRKGAIR